MNKTQKQQQQSDTYQQQEQEQKKASECSSEEIEELRNENDFQSKNIHEEDVKVPQNSSPTLKKKQSSENDFFVLKIKEGEESVNKKTEFKNPDSLPELLICFDDDQEVIPSVALQPSPKGHKPIKIEISSYRTKKFMKIETQFYLLSIKDENKFKQYSIERRFSQFLDLYENIFYNHPGYILHPFPGKNLDSFLKMKLGLGHTDLGQKCQMIEKRMGELQNFVNYLTHHKYLSTCDEIKYFLEENQSIYEEERKRLEKYVEQTKQIQTNSQLKTIYEMSKNFLYSYFKKQDNEMGKQVLTYANEIQFCLILENVNIQIKNVQSLLQHFQKLVLAENNFCNFSDFATQNDILLTLCAKQSSSKQYCEKFCQFLQIQIIYELTFLKRKLEQVEKLLMYRIQIVEAHRQSEGIEEKKGKLERRLELFSRNFLDDWPAFYSQILEANTQIRKKFAQGWKKHQTSMQKIWRIKKN